MKTKVLEEIFEMVRQCKSPVCFSCCNKKDEIEKSLEEIELETAKTIANAARKAGLVPKDLAEYKDWEKSLAKHTEDTLKERVEEVLKDLPSEKLIEELVDRGYSKIELVKQKI
jgi:hypothetical protein